MTDQPTYRYHLLDKGGGAQYGACEVCGATPATIYHQVEQRRYVSPLNGALSWTGDRCRDLFGHEAGLKAQRR